jgi:RNA polymerase sigma-70 factor (ECF subfamily)
MAHPSQRTDSKIREPGQGNLIVLQRTFVGDDAALVAAIRAGHRGARAEFFNRFASQVERIITHVIGFDRDLADILQDTFTRAVGTLDQLESPASLKPWLFRIAAMSARKVLRTRKRRAWLRIFADSEEETRHEPATSMADPDDARAIATVYGILGKLPTDERIAFALRFIEGMELTEVASACRVSLATIKRRLKRAEERFLSAAQLEPTLSDWLERGSRWQTNQ